MGHRHEARSDDAVRTGASSIAMNRAVSLTDKHHHLRELLRDMGSVLVAFSGGIDSTLVFKVAHDTLGNKAIAVTAASPTLPPTELEATRRLSVEIGGRHQIFDTDQLALPDFVRNDAARCYHCKTDLYEGLDSLRAEHGMGTIVDGTNLDDLGDDRPGLLAARERGVRSPLVEAGFSKEDIRALAKELGLSNWDKPAAACLSSRIPRGVMITREKLGRIDRAEAVLIQEGFKQIRVRDHGELARIEVDQAELSGFLHPSRRERITRRLKQLGFRFVTVDLEGYRRGGAG